MEEPHYGLLPWCFFIIQTEYRARLKRKIFERGGD